MVVASQNKRKTNHELFEEDRNKLAIGYRLSAIGYRLILGVLVSVFALQAQSACTFFDGFKDNKDGTVTDPRNGIVWKRCTEGFTWTGSECTGNSTKTSWVDAMLEAKNSRFLGKTDWRIPTKKEFEIILGDTNECLLNEDSGAYAASEKIAHSVDSKNSPGRFWTSTPFPDLDDNFWFVSFIDGAIDYEHYSGGYEHFIGKSANSNQVYSIRLVRATQSSGNGSVSEFKREYTKVVKYKAEIAAKEKQERQEQAKREAQDRDRVANACNNFYQGKSIGFKPAGFSYFGSVLDAVVLGKGNGNVSIKIVDRHFTDLYGKTLEMSCTSDQLQ